MEFGVIAPNAIRLSMARRVGSDIA